MPHTRCKVALTGRVEVAYPPRRPESLDERSCCALGSGTHSSGDAGVVAPARSRARGLWGRRRVIARRRHELEHARPSPRPRRPCSSPASRVSSASTPTGSRASRRSSTQLARRYHELAEAEDFELEALWAAAANEVAPLLAGMKAGWVEGNPVLRAGRGRSSPGRRRSPSTTSSSTRARARPRIPRARSRSI